MSVRNCANRLFTEWTVLVWICKHTLKHISVFLVTGLTAQNPEQTATSLAISSNILLTAIRSRLGSLVSAD